MGSYHLKAQLQMQSTGALFVSFYEVIINCYQNFITCLHFTLALINQLVSELFRSKENLKEKIDSNNN